MPVERRGERLEAELVVALEHDDGPQDLYVFAAVRRAASDGATVDRVRRRIAGGARSSMRALVLHRMASEPAAAGVMRAL